MAQGTLDERVVGIQVAVLLAVVRALIGARFRGQDDPAVLEACDADGIGGC
ncbi:MAG: hypothetical protein QN157_07055 [Armatimonadota bacterium]|nr:hypothetical protein [Armatimonadota bacterium]